jgi:hypothetical protein
MGLGASKQQQQQQQQEEKEEECHCFFFQPPTRPRTKPESLLGTPLPQEYNRKQCSIPETTATAVHVPIRGVQGRASSRYGGLEVSIGGGSNSIYSNGTNSNNNNNNNNNNNSNNTSLPAAIVHEGEVR